MKNPLKIIRNYCWYRRVRKITCKYLYERNSPIIRNKICTELSIMFNVYFEDITTPKQVENGYMEFQGITRKNKVIKILINSSNL